MRRCTARRSRCWPGPGFVARGVIYGTIGLLAIQVAMHAGSRSADQRGAMHAIQQQPFGHWLLVAVAIGLGGYSLWRFVQAFFGSGPEGGGDHSTMGRVIAAASGCAYAAMCVLAVTILLGTSSRAPATRTSPRPACSAGPAGSSWSAPRARCSSSSRCTRGTRECHGSSSRRTRPSEMGPATRTGSP